MRGGEPTSRAIDPSTRRMRLRDSIGRIVKAAWSQTSVIIIEDLHWLDEASQDFLETWIAAVEGTSVLMVLTFRPDWSLPSRPAWYRELALPELGLGEVGQVIRDLIGDGPGLDQVVAHVAERSDGNPFFAEELILSLAQSGVLLGERGRYRLAPSGWQNPTLPTTVEAVIGARIDLLPDSEKALLQTAAIIGKGVSVRGGSSGQRPVRCGRPAAAEAASRGRTDPAAANGDGRKLRVPPSLDSGGGLRDAAAVHAHQSACRRGEGDRGRRSGGGVTSSPGLVAHHYEAAGNMVAAAMHLQRSARWVGRTNSGRALADWKKIRGMMQDQPRSKENDELRALAGGQLLTFGWREGMPVEEAKIYVEEALGYAREAGNRRHEAMLIAGYGRIVAANGSADDYIRLVREALAVLDAEANPAEALLLNGLLCQANMLAGFVGHALVGE